MLVVTPFHPGDADQALTLFRWIRELAGAKGHGLLLVADSRCSQVTVAEIERAAGESFDAVTVLPFVDHFQKWPEAPNATFAFAARHIMAGLRVPWFFMEPDCAPLKPGWLDAIAAEYKTAGKPFLGARVEVDDVPLHMSGNAVYPADMFAHAGIALMHNEIAWDVAAASQIVPQAHFTKLIEHSWKRDHVTKENLRVTFASWEQVEREISPEAVIYHASKDGSLIERLRERKGVAQAIPCSPTVEAADLKSVQCSFESSHGKTFSCDILIKSYPPDFERLGYCLCSINKFASGFRRVVLVIPKGEYAPVDYFVGVPSAIEIVTVEVEESGDGYLFQQCVKANAHEYTDADFVLHIDSDTVLTQLVTPETFMRDGKPLWLMTPYTHLEAGIAELSRANAGFHCGVMTWKAITEKFLGQTVEFEFMRRFPILVPRSLHKAAAAFCQVRHGQRLTDYILSQPAKEFSEFNSLGALAYYRAHDQFSWLDTTKEPLPELVAIQKWSHAPFTDADKAEFEEILEGSDAACRSVPVMESSGAQVVQDTQKPKCSTVSSAAPTFEPECAANNPNITQTKEGIWVLVNDSHISRWVEEHGSLFHDHQVLPKILPEIPVGGTVIDVGANIGDTTAPFLERVGPAGHVYAFEPYYDACECLRRNLAGCSNVTIEQVAVGDVPAGACLTIDNNAGASHIGEGGKGVRIVPLDSREFERCDFLKIDVEGYELNVLHGAERTINRFHPKMLIELNEGALQRQGTNQLEVCAWLQAHGYKWWPVQANLAPDSPQYDILCTYAGTPNNSVSETHAPLPLLAKPWDHHAVAVEQIKELAGELKKFCGKAAHTRIVRHELHKLGVIELPYRFKRRGKWRKRKAKA